MEWNGFKAYAVKCYAKPDLQGKLYPNQIQGQQSVHCPCCNGLIMIPPEVSDKPKVIWQVLTHSFTAMDVTFLGGEKQPNAK